MSDIENLLPTIESYNQLHLKKNGRTAEISRPYLRFFRCSQATRAVSLFKCDPSAQPCWKRKVTFYWGSKMCAQWLVYWVMHRQAQRWIFMPLTEQRKAQEELKAIGLRKELTRANKSGLLKALGDYYYRRRAARRRLADRLSVLKADSLSTSKGCFHQ